MENTLRLTSVFRSGNSLAVRLPKGFDLPLGKVIITKVGDSIVLKSSSNGWPSNIREIFAANDPALNEWTRPEQGDTPESITW